VSIDKRQAAPTAQPTANTEWRSAEFQINFLEAHMANPPTCSCTVDEKPARGDPETGARAVRCGESQHLYLLRPVEDLSWRYSDGAAGVIEAAR
jgi:hypothetical protein